MNLMLPFASKTLPSGEILKRRPRGMTFELAAATIGGPETTIAQMTVPYTKAKINMVEMLWAPEGVSAIMRVKDNAAGTFSTVPNAVLDTFGQDVNLAEGYWKGRSEYDAEVYQSMVLEFEFKNRSMVTKTVGINVVFHEVINAG
jgi:hypothetical protein